MAKQERKYSRSWMMLAVLVGLGLGIVILGAGGASAAMLGAADGKVAQVSASAKTGNDQPDQCGPGSNYVIFQSSGDFMLGQTDIGNHCDDCTTLINLPFPITLYKQFFNTAYVSSNGNLQFVSNNNTYINTCLPNTGFDSTIFPHWGDLRTDFGAGCASYSTGCGIFTSIVGAAPNRRVIIEWRTHDLRSGGADNFELILYEMVDRFDMAYHIVTGNGSTDTVGVQKDAGSGLFTQYSCNTPSLTPGLYLIALAGPCGSPTATMSPTSTPTVTPTIPPCGPRSNYLIGQSGGAPLGGSMLVAGSQGDDIIAPIALPFAFNLYGTPYNNVSASSNGNLQFNTSNATFANTCLPDATMGDAILAHWDDLRTDQAGGGIYTSVSGPVGSRIFTIEWRAVYYSNNAQRADFEVRLHENTGPAGESFFDIFFTLVDQGGSSATIGVQSAVGGMSSQFSCNTASVTPSELLTFTQRPCTTATPTNTRIPTFTATATVTPTPTCVPDNPTLVDVSIVNMTFSPQNVTIGQGSTIRWTNQDTVTHTSSGGIWNSGNIVPGGQFSFTFNVPGTYPYHCNIHTFMSGTIVVLPVCATATPTPTATCQPGSACNTFTPTPTPTCPPTGGCTTPTVTPTVCNDPLGQCTPTPTATPTCPPTQGCNTPTVTRTPCNNPTGQCTPTATPTPTCPPTQGCNSPTATATRTCTPVLIGHVIWQGVPQPDPRSVMPISVTLKLGALEVNYPLQNTDSSGNVQVSTSGLPAGGYAWRAKGPRNLANSGFVDIMPNVCVVTVEMGLMKAGDANNDNVVSIIDFNIFKATNGKGCGDVGYDGRADFNNDCVVNVLDFNLLKSNLGQTGAPPVRPSGKTK